jgi:hypothetical protein
MRQVKKQSDTAIRFKKRAGGGFQFGEAGDERRLDSRGRACLRSAHRNCPADIARAKGFICRERDGNGLARGRVEQGLAEQQEAGGD